MRDMTSPSAAVPQDGARRAVVAFHRDGWASGRAVKVVAHPFRDIVESGDMDCPVFPFPKRYASGYACTYGENPSRDGDLADFSQNP